MTRVASAPLNGDVRRAGGATPTDTDVVFVQHTPVGAAAVNQAASMAPTGVPGFIDFTSAPSGSGACRFRSVAWSDGNGALGTRAELAFGALSVPAAPGHTRYRFHAEYWLPGDWATAPDAAVMQVHAGVSSVFPVLMLFAGGGLLTAATPSVWNSDAPHSSLIQTPAPIERWFSVDFLVWMTKADRGLFALHLDGRRVGKVEPIRTCHDDTSAGPYGKVGIYNTYKHQVSHSMYARNYEIHAGPESDGSFGYAADVQRAAMLAGWY